MQFGFNSGAAFMISPAANPTPDQLGILQSCSLDFKASNKKLYGQNVMAVAVGRSQIDVTGKAKFAQYRSRIFADFFGSTQNTGQTLIAYNEAAAVPGTSPYTVTVSHNATFTMDLGVVYASTGLPLQNVASLTAAGQYTYSAGVYTFYSADEGANVQISYEYTTTGGETVTISNTSAGAASLYTMVLGMQYNGLQGNFTLNAVLPTSMKALDQKIGDFTMPELDFDCICNAAGILGTISLAEVS